MNYQEVAMPQLKPVEIVTEAPIPSIYTNSSRLMHGIYDFRLVFSENMMKGDFSFVQVDRVSVVMSPQHLKKLVSTLTDKLAEYEQQFGLIPEAPEEAKNEGDTPDVDQSTSLVL